MRTGIWLVAAMGALAPALIGQIANLSTNGSGSDVYFTGTMSPSGDSSSGTQKLLLLRNGVLTLVRESTQADPLYRPSDYRYGPTHLDEAGTTRAIQQLPGVCVGGSSCTFPSGRRETKVFIETPGRAFTVRDFAHITPNGRFAYVRMETGTMAGRMDLASGETTTLGEPPIGGIQLIANDAAAVVARTGGLRLLRMAGEATDFETAEPMDEGQLAADGSRLVYIRRGTDAVRPIRVVDIATNRDRQVAEGRWPSLAYDGRTFSFINANEVRIGDAVTGELRPLFRSSEGISQQVLSGDGSRVLVFTGLGRLLSIRTDTGEVTQLRGTDGPGFVQWGGALVPGSFVELQGNFPPDFEVEIRVDGRPVGPLPWTRTGYLFQLPWETPVGALVEWYLADPYAGGGKVVRSATVSAFSPKILTPPIHQDWRGIVNFSDPARLGEVVHLFGTGLGVVAGRVEVGQPTPGDRLYPILGTPKWAITTGGRDAPIMNVNVLFAGLAPGFVGIYQLDVEIPVAWRSTSLTFGFRADSDFFVSLASVGPIAVPN